MSVIPRRVRFDLSEDELEDEPEYMPGDPQPLFVTQESWFTISCQDVQVTATIDAKFLRGFFQFHNDWTCYRRNYVDVEVSYSLRPNVPNRSLTLYRGNGAESILSMSVKLSAEDAATRKSIKLYECSNKRWKEDVKMAHLDPSQPDLQVTNTHTFERIQFKDTPNNSTDAGEEGFYVLKTELWAWVTPVTSGISHCVKIGTSTSELVVARGRGPSEYRYPDGLYYRTFLGGSPPGDGRPGFVRQPGPLQLLAPRPSGGRPERLAYPEAWIFSVRPSISGGGQGHALLPTAWGDEHPRSSGGCREPPPQPEVWEFDVHARYFGGRQEPPRLPEARRNPLCLQQPEEHRNHLHRSSSGGGPVEGRSGHHHMVDARHQMSQRPSYNLPTGYSHPEWLQPPPTQYGMGY